MEKHSAYFNLLEQLQSPACPICEQTHKSLQNFLDSYLYEGVNDHGNWARLAASGGWCARHAKQQESFSDGLAVALFYGVELRHRLKRLGQASKRSFFRREPLPAACPACAYQDGIEAGQLHLIAQCLGEAEFLAAFEKHPGLCLPHDEAVLQRLSGEAASHFKALAAEKLEFLCGELDEIVRKHDYRNEERMGKEGDAWKRALRRLYGINYDF